MNVLDEISVRTKLRIEEKKKSLPRNEIAAMAEELSIRPDFPFENALRREGLNFICEIKKASPSKGVISEGFPYLQIAREYEAANAAAISVLTEPFWFQGSDRYLCEIAGTVSIPLLRKDFVIDIYMVYEAKLLGASAILLICGILSPGQLSEYIHESHRLGLSCLVEAHDEDELQMALQAGARVVGVNNRDLKTFTVDMANSVRLRELVSESVIFVAESGIKCAEDIMMLRRKGINNFLIGEKLMCSPDIAATMALLRGES